MVRAAAALLVTIAAACAARQRSPSIAELPSNDFSGHLTVTARGYWFDPCGAPGSRWWVTFIDGSVGRLETARSSGDIPAEGSVYVRLRGAMTDERLVGPGGPALLVREILGVEPGAGCDPETR